MERISLKNTPQKHFSSPKIRRILTLFFCIIKCRFFIRQSGILLFLNADSSVCGGVFLRCFQGLYRLMYCLSYVLVVWWLRLTAVNAPFYRFRICYIIANTRFPAFNEFLLLKICCLGTIVYLF